MTRFRGSNSRQRSSTVETPTSKTSMSGHTIQVEFTRLYRHCYSHHTPQAKVLLPTGAGLGDATLGDSSHAALGFLNGTVMQFNISDSTWSFFMPSPTTYDGTSPSHDNTYLSSVVAGCPVQRYLTAYHGTCWPKRFYAADLSKCISTNRINSDRTVRADMANGLIAWYPVRLNAGTYSTMFSINETGLQWDTSGTSSFGGWLGMSHHLLRTPCPLLSFTSHILARTDQARFR